SKPTRCRAIRLTYLATPTLMKLHAETRAILRMSRQGYAGQSQLQRFVGEWTMTNTKWLRRVLLGGVALTVAGTAGARADELSDLKAQLEALQSRVNTMEQQPAQASNLPPGASFVTFERGSRMDFVAQDRASDRVNQNDD